MLRCGALPVHHVATCVCSGPGWWTVAAPLMQSDPELSPLLHRTMHILLTVLRLRLPAAWKILQLSVVMLWNAAVQSGKAHGAAHSSGGVVCMSFHTICAVVCSLRCKSMIPVHAGWTSV